MQKLTFNHRQMKEIKVLETGLICVHYTHEQHGVNVHVFNNWKDFYDGHPNLMYLLNVAWSKLKSFLHSINIFTRRP